MRSKVWLGCVVLIALGSVTSSSDEPPIETPDIESANQTETYENSATKKEPSPTEEETTSSMTEELPDLDVETKVNPNSNIDLPSDI